MQQVPTWLAGVCVLALSGCPAAELPVPMTKADAGPSPAGAAPSSAGTPAAHGGGAGALSGGAGGSWSTPVPAQAGAGAGGSSAGSGPAAEGGTGGEAGRRARAGRGALPLGGAAGLAAGSGGGQSRAGSGGGAAGDGCTQNLACQLQPAASSGDARQDCVDRVNQFRTQCACLPPLQRWTDGEACADQMAEYDSGKNSAHAGFGAGICKGGNAQNECPGWSSEGQIVSGCLQQMWNEGPPPMSPCSGMCFQTYGHFINMTNKSMKKVACGFFKTEQNKVWSVQNFSP